MGATSFPSAEQVVTTAISQNLTVENPAGTNRTKYGAAYGWNGVAWCGIFVWWVFNACGIDLRQSGIADPAYTPSFFNEARKAGWIWVNAAEIEPGDILFYDFAPPFTTAGIQHVGIAVSKPSMGLIHTVEGNTTAGDSGVQDNGGGVFLRTRNLSLIVGVVRPPYTKGRNRKRTPLVVKPKKPTRILKEGMTGDDVKALQRMLNRKTSDKPKLVEDGVFGSRTDSRLRVFQHRHLLFVDGEAGPQSIYALWS